MYLLNVHGVSNPYFNKINTNVSFREIARLITRNRLWSAAFVNGAIRVKVICTLYRCSAINVLLRFPIARGDLEFLGTGASK